MSEKDRQESQEIAALLESLPKGDQQKVIGVATGLILARNSAAENTAENEKSA